MRRAPIPGWLKSRLLPAWNAAHRVAWRVGETAEALASRRLEHCVVCGRTALMLYRRRVIPPRLEAMWGLSPRLAGALARKESLDCANCGAKLRGRRLAATLLELAPAGREASSLRAWARRCEARSLGIAEINRIDGLHEILTGLPGFSGSEFEPGAAPGSIVSGQRFEDLSRLSYPDLSFDFVLTSETLEHVPDLDAALCEIRRVLRPGGYHIFTIPLLPGVERSYRRTDGLCHPGGDTGYPVVTEFGADLPALVTAHGFEVEMRFGPIDEDNLAQVWVARRA